MRKHFLYSVQSIDLHIIIKWQPCALLKLECTKMWRKNSVQSRRETSMCSWEIINNMLHGYPLGKMRFQNHIDKISANKQITLDVHRMHLNSTSIWDTWMTSAVHLSANLFKASQNCAFQIVFGAAKWVSIWQMGLCTFLEINWSLQWRVSILFAIQWP